MTSTASIEFAPGDFNGRSAILADQIAAATNCPADVARIAAGSFHGFRNAPDHGFGDPPRDLQLALKCSAARVALAGWKAAQAAPALALKVAA